METLHLKARRQGDLETAASLLQGGGIVAFPTETVYGLGALADDPDAVRMLIRLKRRSREKKFALLIPDIHVCERYAAPLSDPARRLAERFWPGPLTLVLPDGRGGATGLRVPDCEPTRKLLRLTGGALAAPSANVSGRPPAKTATEVLEVFDGKIAGVLDGGPSRVGTASTVVRVRGAGLEVLRPGAISEEDLRKAASPAPKPQM